MGITLLESPAGENSRNSLNMPLLMVALGLLYAYSTALGGNS